MHHFALAPRASACDAIHECSQHRGNGRRDGKDGSALLSRPLGRVCACSAACARLRSKSRLSACLTTCVARSRLALARPLPRRQVRFTSAALPASARLKDGAGLPFGCAVRPLAASGERLGAAAPQALLARASQVARCEECFAYISPCCHTERRAWRYVDMARQRRIASCWRQSITGSAALALCASLCAACRALKVVCGARSS